MPFFAQDRAEEIMLAEKRRREEEKAKLHLQNGEDDLGPSHRDKHHHLRVNHDFVWEKMSQMGVLIDVFFIFSVLGKITYLQRSGSSRTITRSHRSQ